jgi:hypothetical protein
VYKQSKTWPTKLLLLDILLKTLVFFVVEVQLTINRVATNSRRLIVIFLSHQSASVSSVGSAGEKLTVFIGQKISA